MTNMQIVPRDVIPDAQWKAAVATVYPQHAGLFSRILAARNITELEALSNQLKGLLHYQTLRGLDAAVAILCRAITQQQRVVIVGDFDADGATSTALCMLALRGFGLANVDFLVPNRFDFGYGLSPSLVDIAHAQMQADVLLTVDNGISAIDGVARANELGMQVVITDHHLPGEQVPNAAAIVNPNQADCAFMGKNSAGVGVAFYVLSAVRAALQQQGWFDAQRPMPNLAEWLDIVALGTVADVVPLDHNNRILVYQGISRIRRRLCRPGILALLEVAGKVPEKLNVSDLGFILGPRLNAAGRLDDMSVGIMCLLTDDHLLAKDLARQLDDYNRNRKAIEQTMRDDAQAHLDELQLHTESLPAALVLHRDSFHEGVIGIVAGRIKEQCYRPTVVFASSDGAESSSEPSRELKGSARSIPGLHIRDALELVNTRHPKVIKKFGGHAMAAGLTIAQEHLALFEQAFIDAVAELGRALPDCAQIETDGSLRATDLDLQLAHQLEHLCVWGQGCPAPVFDNTFDVISQRIVGEKHLKLVLSLDGQTVDAIAFNVDTALWPNLNCQQIHAAYSLQVNEFRNRESVQCLLHTFSAV